jgi:hypothetical protein
MYDHYCAVHDHKLVHYDDGSADNIFVVHNHDCPHNNYNSALDYFKYSSYDDLSAADDIDKSSTSNDINVGNR